MAIFLFVREPFPLLHTSSVDSLKGKPLDVRHLHHLNVIAYLVVVSVLMMLAIAVNNLDVRYSNGRCSDEVHSETH